jgi:ATP-dependent DNA helicase RecG
MKWHEILQAPNLNNHRTECSIFAGMESARDLLMWLLRQGNECEWLEFKENYHSADEIGETISALANGACLQQQSHGYLVFGVKDNLDFTGTSFDPAREKKGNEIIENWIIQRLSPKVDFIIRNEIIDGKRTVIVEIPAAKDQPVKFSNESFIRISSISRKLKDFPDKERKIWGSRPDTAFVKEIAKRGLHAQDVIDLLDTQSVFDLLKKPYPSGREETLQKLIEENLIIKERGQFGITNLGAVLFAKRMDNFPTVARKATRLIIYEGSDKLKTIRDVHGRMGYATAFEAFINYVHGQLPANEEITRVIRQTVNMYPKEAIREIVANALVHQDFSESGTGPTVEIYSDRIEVTNPGIPLLKTTRFIDGYKSRNEALASMMRRMGICEEKGSGIDRVVYLSELFQLPAPDFRALENQTQAILYAHRKLSEMDKQDKVRACYQHCSLRYVSNNQMTNQSLRERFKIESQNAAIASRIIADTVEADLIKLEDPENKSKKYAKYVPFWA